MIMKTAATFCAAFLLVACGEKPQDSLGSRMDQPAVVGTGVAVYTDPGWTAGDKASWANHLKARAQYGQNDHARAPK
jgi:hypothetical protein